MKNKLQRGYFIRIEVKLVQFPVSFSLSPLFEPTEPTEKTCATKELG